MPQLDDAAGVRTVYDDEGEGPPVVVLHGGLESDGSWTDFAAALAGRHRVLRPDRRGHGRTPTSTAPPRARRWPNCDSASAEPAPAADARRVRGAIPGGDEHWPIFHAPVLVVVGADDVVDHHHTIELFEALSDGQLAIVPGASHLLPIEHPELLLALVRRFIDGQPSVRMMPMRTA